MIAEGFNICFQTCLELQKLLTAAHKSLVGKRHCNTKREFQIFCSLLCNTVHFAKAEKLVKKACSLQKPVNKGCFFKFFKDLLQPATKMGLAQVPAGRKLAYSSL